ncbi:hypothetical protein [Thermogemmatispora sp.]|uniref:hypothetical protein n=1 Tax=Thermogemmatispora sp. TaxID=1968838 RepID=UPI0035E43B45
MKRISALLFSLSLLVWLAALLFLGAGQVRAASLSAAVATVPASCLSATPPEQQVVLGQPAKILISVYCYQPTLFTEVLVAWGDGSLWSYPLCADACRVPPITLVATHVYSQIGTYAPLVCLQGAGLSAGSPVATCVSLKVTVLPPTPVPLD